jgi:hypothetical protein
MSLSQVHYLPLAPPFFFTAIPDQGYHRPWRDRHCARCRTMYVELPKPSHLAGGVGLISRLQHQLRTPLCCLTLRLLDGALCLLQLRCQRAGSELQGVSKHAAGRESAGLPPALRGAGGRSLRSRTAPAQPRNHSISGGSSVPLSH